MKIIHCADLHLDSNMTSNLSREQAKQRKAELLATFERMIAYAKDNFVKAVIIAGDLYDKKNISANARNVFLSAINNNPDITFYYLRGNHDAESLFIDCDTIPDNIKMFNDSWTSYTIEAPEDNSVITINGVELTADNSNVIYNSLVLDSNNYNIVTLHGQEAMSSSKDKTEVISLKELKNKAIDYLALGHIHSYKMEQLDSRGVYCYPGCLEGRGFDECGEHGFVLLDIKDNKLVGNEFISVSYRNLYEEDVDISECMNSVEMAEKVREVLYKKDYASASLIKVVLTGQIDINAEKNLTYITENFKNDYYYFKLYDHTSIKVDYSSYQYDKSLKGEFVRLVESDDTLDDITKASIIKIGIDALSGEEFI